VLFVNPRSGGGKAGRAWLVERARALSIEVEVVRPERALAVLLDHAVARGADALSAAGGDGWLALVAATAAARDLPFVCSSGPARSGSGCLASVERSPRDGSAQPVHWQRRGSTGLQPPNVNVLSDRR
jgi:hypothetical protein